MDNKPHFSEKILNNAHKVAFVLQQYPEKKLPNVIDLLAMPAVDINSALWAAQDLGYIAEPNKDTGEVKFLAEPENGWEFGESVNDLKLAIVYCLSVLARREADLEEFFISKWTGGYPVMDVLVSMKSLLVNGQIAEYELKDHRRDDKGNLMYADDENTPVYDSYVFYTLPQFVDQKWGRKSFKEQPKEA